MTEGKGKKKISSNQATTTEKEKKLKQNKTKQQKTTTNRNKNVHFSRRQNYLGNGNEPQLLKYFFCIWEIEHQIKTLTFNRSHFLPTRNSTPAFFFLPIIWYCSVRDNNTKKYWQSEVSYTDGRCYASAWQTSFLWVNHPTSKRKWCYIHLGADSHCLPASLPAAVPFLWELLTNSVK